jgi:hypothetical protein
MHSRFCRNIVWPALALSTGCLGSAAKLMRQSDQLQNAGRRDFKGCTGTTELNP